MEILLFLALLLARFIFGLEQTAPKLFQLMMEPLTQLLWEKINFLPQDPQINNFKSGM